MPHLPQEEVEEHVDELEQLEEESHVVEEHVEELEQVEEELGHVVVELQVEEETSQVVDELGHVDEEVSQVVEELEQLEDVSHGVVRLKLEQGLLESVTFSHDVHVVI